MKLAYIANSAIPSRAANSIHVMKMCSAFSKLNNSVTLIVPENVKTEPDVDNIYEYYGVPDCFTVKKVPIKLPNLITKHIRKHYQLARYAAKGDFDYIYSRDLQACFFLAKIFRKPFILEYHDPLVSKSSEEKAFQYIVKTKYLRRLVVITQSLKQYFVEQYKIDEASIYVAPDGADIPLAAPAPGELTGASKGKFHIGYIGHLYQGRGMELLGDIAASCPSAFFHIIGGNDKDIIYWKDKYKNISNIHFYGFIHPAKTASLGKCMDVLIAPYQHIVATSGKSSIEESTAKWMSPLKIFEYMALGKAVIASDLPVLKEVLTDGINGIMCAPDDASAWSRAINRLYDDKELLNKLAENASKTSEKYTWGSRAKNILGDVICGNCGEKRSAFSVISHSKR